MIVSEILLGISLNLIETGPATYKLSHASTKLQGKERVISDLVRYLPETFFRSLRQMEKWREMEACHQGHAMTEPKGSQKFRTPWRHSRVHQLQLPQLQKLVRNGEYPLLEGMFNMFNALSHR